ncbi:MAG: MFS transporter [Verrucomicrobia bacterium]|nr:MFS transporter [Verrucomicrobiota bacterium]
MFRSPQAYRTFLTVVFTYTLDLVGYSIVFPVLAPLLLNPELSFFEPNTTVITKTTVLGLLYALFGVAQFIGAPIVGALADHYGRYKAFLGSIALSVIGYAIMGLSIYEESLGWLFVGRIITGFCSGNFSLAQSATADLTHTTHRSKAFGILMGVGGLGFVAGPLIGGKLSNPDWLFGAGAFIFAAVAAIINFLMVLFFFVETRKPTKDETNGSLLSTIKDIRIVFHHKTLRIILIAQLFFLIGWAFFLVFSPTYLVQRFSLGSDKIGDFFAYMALWWAFSSMYLNKELTEKFPSRSLILTGMFVGAVALASFVSVGQLWPYWIILAVNQLGGALAWINLGTILSLNTPENMQGRAMGVSGSMWSIGQIIAPLVAGPLAGWKIFSPLLVGSLCILIGFIYFLLFYREKVKRLSR